MDPLDRMLERWQRRGILTAAQAEEIRAAESSARDERRIPLVAEVLGYLGAAFVLSAAAALTAQYWSELEAVARGAVLLVVTALLVLAGSSVARSEEPAFRRLARLLWFAAVGGAGLFADVVATDALDLGAGFSLPTGAVMSGLGLALWRLHPSALQLVSVFAGVVLLIAGISDLLGGDDAFGLLLWGVGVASLLLARRRIVSPERTAYALACAAILLGAQWAVEPFGDTRGWALALGFRPGSRSSPSALPGADPSCLASGPLTSSSSCHSSWRSISGARLAAPPSCS